MVLRRTSPHRPSCHSALPRRCVNSELRIRCHKATKCIYCAVCHCSAIVVSALRVFRWQIRLVHGSTHAVYATSPHLRRILAASVDMLVTRCKPHSHLNAFSQARGRSSFRCGCSHRRSPSCPTQIFRFPWSTRSSIMFQPPVSPFPLSPFAASASVILQG